jgi:predicted HicB family RNase H-like nuclease
VRHQQLEQLMSREDSHFRLRIPADIKARIADAAQKSRRSLNAEIIVALEKIFPDPAAGGEQA